MKAVVSDHALLRWLERHHGLDVEHFRRELADIAQPAVDIRATTAPLPDGLWLLIKESTVVTVSPGKPKPLLPLQQYACEGEPHWKHRTRKRRK